MDLLNSAKIFLIESLDNYQQSLNHWSKQDLTFSILHIMIAVELLLKERLRLIDKNLIYEKNKLGLIIKNRTIKISAIPRRLKKNGVVLNKEQKNLIKKVSSWRNDIAHNVPTHDDLSAKVKLEELYNFTITFLKTQLNLDIEEFLSKKYYKLMEDYIDELKKKILAAKQKAQESWHPDVKHYCPVCNITGVVEIRNDDYAYCHLCNEDLHTPICAECEKHLHIYKSGSRITEDEYCNDCIKAARDLYIERLIDLQHRK